ncbi:MAG: nicotinate-nucleotide adenylyltransferase [Candidatus Zixiibacteriota bacterium]
MKPSPDHGHWGILGGTFDPVHYGHLTLADEIRTGKQLDGILFVPTVNHPFKGQQCLATFADRVHMLELATQERPDFLASRIEEEENLSGYTLDTVRALKRRYPDTRFVFVIGADLLEEIGRWCEPEKILQEVPIVVGGRPSYAGTLPTSLPSDRIELVKTELVDVSSTEVRRKIAEQVPATELERLIPAEVRTYIEQKELYR